MPLWRYIAFSSIMRERCPFQLSWFAQRRALCAEQISAGKSLNTDINHLDNAFGIFSLPLSSDKCYSGPGFSLWRWMGVLRASRLRCLPVWACWSSQLSLRAVSAQTPPTAPLPYKDKGERENECVIIKWWKRVKQEQEDSRLSTNICLFIDFSQYRWLDVILIKGIPSVHNVA